ncbi:hypothetical protein MMC22_006508 [Lobaria immixta]|nr:hypothetical protein [Lobaria immixta]
MPFFINPFKKHDVKDFDVHVDLANAERHPSVVTARDRNAAISADGKLSTDIEVRGSHALSGYTVDTLRAEIDLDVAASGHDSVYDRKSKIINKAIQDIGMGRYQKQLFVLCGFGWLADNLWLQGLALTLPSLTSEFGPSETQVRYTTCAAFLGLCIGASFWGIASDVIGRRIAFNATLFIAGVFGLAIGGGSTWIGTCGLFASLGVGIGGNLPVDGALFLEFLPMASGSMLTLLSVWWPLGQLLASLIAWGLIPKYSCGDEPSCDISAPGVACCHKAQNMGWRYFSFTLGALTLLMFACRLFLFHLYESPKFLLARGRQAEAVAAVHGIAYKNKRKTWLTEEILNEIGESSAETAETGLPRGEVIKRFFGNFSAERIAPLFATRRQGTMRMGYPLFNGFLPQYLKNSGQTAPTPTKIVYRNYAITSIVGVPGSLIAYYTVDIKYIGRKYTIAMSSLLTGILLCLFTVSSDPNYQLVMTCLEAFVQNIMYGVLYA